MLQSSVQNQTILASVELGLLCVFWDHWVDWDSETTVCKVCTDLLPPTQLWLHCTRGCALVGGTKRQIPLQSPIITLFACQRRSYSNEESRSSPAKLMRMSLYQKCNFSIVTRMRVQIKFLGFTVLFVSVWFDWSWSFSMHSLLRQFASVGTSFTKQ